MRLKTGRRAIAAISLKPRMLVFIRTSVFWSHPTQRPFFMFSDLMLPSDGYHKQNIFSSEASSCRLVWLKNHTSSMINTKPIIRIVWIWLNNILNLGVSFKFTFLGFLRPMRAIKEENIYVWVRCFDLRSPRFGANLELRARVQKKISSSKSSISVGSWKWDKTNVKCKIGILARMGSFRRYRRVENAR